jgi:transposase
LRRGVAHDPKIAVHRHALTEDQWRRLQAVLPKQKAGPPATLGDRLFIEAVLFRAKTAMPWRDLPERFGPWKSVYNRFNNWAKKGHWELIFNALQLEFDEVGSIVDGSVVRAHQDASGGKGGPEQCPRPFSRRGFDQTPRRRRHERSPHLRRDHVGQRHEMIKADELLANAPGKAFIADTGYDSNTT